MKFTILLENFKSALHINLRIFLIVIAYAEVLY